MRSGPIFWQGLEASGNICVATMMTPGITVACPEGGTLEFVEFDDPYTGEALALAREVAEKAADAARPDRTPATLPPSRPAAMADMIRAIAPCSERERP